MLGNGLSIWQPAVYGSLALTPSNIYDTSASAITDAAGSIITTAS